MTDSPLPELPITVRFPVHWGEMDAFGHVNNVTYFRYFESARIAYFDAIGYRESMELNGVGPILASTSCRFRRPLAYPDDLVVGVGVSEVGEDAFTMQYAVWSRQLGTVAAKGEGAIVNYDYRNGHRTPLSADVREAIARLEDRA
jgi:acyl-CoA thioester hydrolase